MLYLRPHWLSLVLAGEKTMEIRDRRLGLGKWFLACEAKVHGSVEVVEAVLIKDMVMYDALFAEHRFQCSQLPYRTTVGLRLADVQHFASPVPYRHLRGAVGTPKFRPLAGAPDSHRADAERKILKRPAVMTPAADTCGKRTR